MLPSKITDFKTKAAFISILLFTVVFAILSHEGVYYTDDMNYSKYAINLLHDSFEITDNTGITFIHRLTVFVPVALFYKLFGINLISYTLWPLLCTLGCLTVVFIVCRKESDTTAVSALIFLSLNFYFIYFSNILYPDNIVAFFALLAAVILYCHQGALSWKAIIWGVLFSISLFLAFLAKETAALFIPFFLVKFLLDVYQKQNVQFWLWALLSGLLLVLGYLGWYYIETGNPLYRFAEIERTNNYLPNYLTQPARSMVYRLTWQPIHTLLNTGTFPLLVFLFGGRWLNGYRQLNQSSYWTLLGLSGLLVLWFVSTSYSSYNPINLDGRMFNLLIPVLAIAAALNFKVKLTNYYYTTAYTILFLLAAVLLSNSMSLIYSLLSLYFGLHTLLLRKKIHIPAIITVLIMGCCFAIRPVYFALKPKTLYFQQHLTMYRFMQEYGQSNTATIIIPQYLLNGISFFNRYEQTDTVNYQVHGNSLSSSSSGEVLLFENSGITDQPPFSSALPSESLQRLYPDRELIKEVGPLKLFKLL